MKHKNPVFQPLEDDLLNSILDSSTEYAIIVTDNSGKTILWNKGAENIYGYTSEEILGKTPPLLLDEKSAVDDDILFLSGGTLNPRVLDYKMNAIRKDGSTLPVLITVTPRHNDRNEMLGHLIISRDNTKNYLQEQFRDVLLEINYLINFHSGMDLMSNEVISTVSKLLNIPVIFICLFDKFNNALTVTSDVGLCDKCNHSCNLSFDDGLAPLNQEDCFNTAFELTINTGLLSEHAIVPYIKNQDIVNPENSIIHIPLISDVSLIGILHVVIPTSRKNFFHNETQILSLLANEISAGLQRKRLEEEINQYAANLEKMVQDRTNQLREKDAQLVQSGKLATLGEMATGIAHEINQPLGGISLMAEGLLMAKERGKLTDEMLNDKLMSILKQTERINKIITHLRGFARQSGNSRQKVKINEPLNDVFKLVGEQLKNRRINVFCEIPQDLPPVLADHNRLEQVFLNIVGNARDALEEFEAKMNNMKRDGTADDWMNSWSKKITVKCYAKSGSVMVEVADNAGGIPENIRQKIFEPFFTTKEVGKGTGLGLSISYGIVKEFEGSISFESEEMKGSKFIVSLPIYK